LIQLCPTDKFASSRRGNIHTLSRYSATVGKPSKVPTEAPCGWSQSGSLKPFSRARNSYNSSRNDDTSCVLTTRRFGCSQTHPIRSGLAPARDCSFKLEITFCVSGVCTIPWRVLLSVTSFRKSRFHLCLTPACRSQPEVFVSEVRWLKAAAVRVPACPRWSGKQGSAQRWTVNLSLNRAGDLHVWRMEQRHELFRSVGDATETPSPIVGRTLALAAFEFAYR
jgi:hypothetical protein